jgi:hypothetical protein
MYHKMWKKFDSNSSVESDCFFSSAQRMCEPNATVDFHDGIQGLKDLAKMRVNAKVKGTDVVGEMLEQRAGSGGSPVVLDEVMDNKNNKLSNTNNALDGPPRADTLIAKESEDVFSGHTGSARVPAQRGISGSPKLVETQANGGSTANKKNKKEGKDSEGKGDSEVYEGKGDYGDKEESEDSEGKKGKKGKNRRAQAQAMDLIECKVFAQQRQACSRAMEWSFPELCRYCLDIGETIPDCPDSPEKLAENSDLDYFQKSYCQCRFDADA